MIEAIGLISSIIGIIMFFPWIIEQYKKYKTNKILNIASTEQIEEPQKPMRNIKNIADLKFIESLPEEKSIVERNAQKLFDTGVTSTMRKGNSEIIDFLETTWLKLSEFYMSNSFGTNSPNEYISKYIQDRFAYHYAKYNAGEERNLGTITHVLVGGDVRADLTTLIDDTVCALSFQNDEFDYLEWKKRWN